VPLAQARSPTPYEPQKCLSTFEFGPFLSDIDRGPLAFGAKTMDLTEALFFIRSPVTRIASKRTTPVGAYLLTTFGVFPNLT